MQLTNFNSLTITLFIIILLGGSILLYSFFRRREKLKKVYKLLFNQSAYYYFKYIFLLISFIIISAGLFDIKYGEKTSKQEVNGIDIAFVLDVSKSMNALDFQEGRYSVSRLDFSKALISEYIAANPENRYGLVIFAGDAISSSPLTTDHSTFLTFLQNVDYKNLNIQGTNLEKAVELGVQRLFSQKGDDNRAKALILLSDGGDEGEKVDFEYIGGLTKDKTVSNFVIGIGKKSGAKIPIGQDMFGNISYQKYKGQDVITKLNSDILTSLSSTLNGKYSVANEIDDFDSIVTEINSLEKKAIEVAGGENKKDFSRILAIISLIFFIMYLLFSIVGIHPPSGTSFEKGRKYS